MSCSFERGLFSVEVDFVTGFLAAGCAFMYPCIIQKDGLGGIKFLKNKIKEKVDYVVGHKNKKKSVKAVYPAWCLFM